MIMMAEPRHSTASSRSCGRPWCGPRSNFRAADLSRARPRDEVAVGQCASGFYSRVLPRTFRAKAPVASGMGSGQRAQALSHRLQHVQRLGHDMVI
jgi:hypothetical protein